MVIGGVEPTASQKRYRASRAEAFPPPPKCCAPVIRRRDAFEAAKQPLPNMVWNSGITPGIRSAHQSTKCRAAALRDTPIQVAWFSRIETGAYEGAQGDTGRGMEKSVYRPRDAPEILCILSGLSKPIMPMRIERIETIWFEEHQHLLVRPAHRDG